MSHGNDVALTALGVLRVPMVCVVPVYLATEICHVYGPFEFRTSLGTSILLYLSETFKQLEFHQQIYCATSEPKIKFVTFVYVCLQPVSQQFPNNPRTKQQKKRPKYKIES